MAGNLHLYKFERRDGSDRNDFGKAALNFCRAARAQDGVRDARFYWLNWDTVGIAVNAEAGKFGPGSNGGQPVPEMVRAGYGLFELAKLVSDELWADAVAGEQAYQIATS